MVNKKEKKNFCGNIRTNKYTRLLMSNCFAFVVFSALGILIGFINGWKTAFYFLCWNLVGTLVTVLVIDNLFDSLIKVRIEEIITRNFLQDVDQLNQRQVWYLISFVKDIIILQCVLACYLLTSLLGFIVYFFVRKKLKGSLKKAKEYGNSTFLSRFLGSTIGLVNTLPLTAAIAGSATFVSRNTIVNRSISYLTQGATFGVVNDISQKTDDIYTVTSLAGFASDFASIFQDEELSEGSKVNLRTNAPNIAKTFNSYDLSELIGNLLFESFREEEKVNFTESKDYFVDKINEIFTDLEKDQKTILDLTDKGKENLKSVLLKISKNKDTLAIDEIVDSLTK